MMPMLPFTPSPSIVSAYARVDKATSEFLNCPDWRINIAICDTINSKHWLAKDYIKAVRARLQHKNPNVQLLSLTLLETLVKNCSEHIHAQIAERKILHEMIKIVKKKTHMRVREKILVLIDTWQDAFSARGGKTAQYHHAYEELRRYGVEFPRRSPNTVPIITPPANHSSITGAGSSTRQPTGSSTDNLSLTTLESMKNVVDLLSDMLQAVDAKDRAALKDEVIVDLTDQCRSNQKKLGQMLASTTDEELLRRGLQFNDMLQYILEKHDAIASGSPVPVQPSSSSNHSPDAHKARLKHIESTEVDSKSSIVVSAPMIPSSTNEIEEERNHSAPMANRHYETQTVVSENGAAIFDSKSDEKATADPALTMALVLSDSPPPANKKSAEDMIDFLSIALSPAQASTSNNGQTSQSSTVMENQTQVPLNSYVVPWAQAQAQAQPQPDIETQPPFQTISQQADYIPPPWAPTPGYYCNPYASSYSTASYYNNGPSAGAGLNPYIPSYRLFEDLNVLGNLRTSGTPGTSGPSMLGARK